MEPVQRVLYLDFDNVFSALAKLDPKIAMSFAEQPRAWLRRLAHRGQDDPPRRWLVLRCCMNPAGWIPHPDNTRHMSDVTYPYGSPYRDVLGRWGGA